MMRCPRCPDSSLARRMTDRGVEVDLCTKCRGVWLDRGEIFSFAMDTRALAGALDQARRAAQPGQLKSPAAGVPMSVLKLLGIEIDECPKSGGLWLDRGELSRLTGTPGIRLRVDESVEPPAVAPIAAAPTPAPTPTGAPGGGDAPPPAVAARMASIAAGTTRLPSLFLRSATLLFTMYGMLGLVLIAAVEFGRMPAVFAPIIGIGFAVVQFILSPWIMDFSLWAFYRCRNVEPGELPPHLRQFVERVCADRRLNFPQFKIIDDGAPNAFTYGHYPGNARLVITRGILELLDPAEVEAVVGHEIGHAVHWDMVLMTLAQLVPLVLYYLYRTLMSIRTRGRDQSAAARYAIAIGAYILYIVSQYLVLWFSRTREYHADRFSGRVTGNPNALASGLVKIAYGLASQPGRTGQEGERRREVEAIGAMGIFDAGAARSLAIASGSRSGGLVVDKDRLQDAMKWDRWNPWAKYYEIHLTHPLVANRLSYLAEQAASMGQTPFVVFSRRKPESYWDDFFVDLFVLWLPWLVFLAGSSAAAATHRPWVLGLGVAAAGIAYMMQIAFSYPSKDFPLSNVSGLLKHVKVSGVRPVPCSLQGRIIGKGVPGLVWSEDFVMQDDSGIMFLDYRQPLRIWEFFFGLLRAGDWQGRDVTITGWYRRAPMPYVELKTIDAGGGPSTCYVLWLKWITSFVLVLGGLAVAFWLATHRL